MGRVAPRGGRARPRKRARAVVCRCRLGDRPLSRRQPPRARGLGDRRAARPLRRVRGGARRLRALGPGVRRRPVRRLPVRGRRRAAGNAPPDVGARARDRPLAARPLPRAVRRRPLGLRPRRGHPPAVRRADRVDRGRDPVRTAGDRVAFQGNTHGPRGSGGGARPRRGRRRRGPRGARRGNGAASCANSWHRSRRGTRGSRASLDRPPAASCATYAVCAHGETAVSSRRRRHRRAPQPPPGSRLVT